MRKKRPAFRPALPMRSSKSARAETRLLGRSLGVNGLDRLESLLGELRIELADLGRFRDKGLIGGLGELGLNLDGGLDILGAEQLFDDGRVGGDRLLRIVARFGGDFLQTLREGGGRRRHSFKLLFAELLDFFNIGEHGFGLSICRRVWKPADRRSATICPIPARHDRDATTGSDVR